MRTAFLHLKKFYLSCSLLIVPCIVFGQQLDWVSVENSGFSSNAGNAILSITSDFNGDVYALGSFGDQLDVDPGPATFFIDAGGYSGMFIQKLSTDRDLIWAKPILSSGGIQGYDIKTDSLGNIYVTGIFGGTVDFDPGLGIQLLTSNGDADWFVLKLNVDGNFIWGRSFGGIYNDAANCVAVDEDLNVYVSGTFRDSVDFDPGPAVYDLVPEGIAGDGFVQKLDKDGNFVWVKLLNGTNVGEYTYHQIVSNIIYLTGKQYGTNADFDPGPGIFNLNLQGSYDTFVQKLDTAGNFIWAKSFGGIGNDISEKIEVDESENIIVAGSFASSSIDFDPGTGVDLKYPGGPHYDAYVTKLDSAGSYLWSAHFGAWFNDFTHGLAIDTLDNIYITGEFRESVDFDPTILGQNILVAASSQYEDIFVVKLSPNGDGVWAFNIGDFTDEDCYTIHVDADQSIYCGGNISASPDFDPGPDLAEYQGNYFTVKYLPCLNSKDTILASGCNSYTVPSGSATYYKSGMYSDTLLKAGGCDSVLVIDLTLDKDYDTIYVNSCAPYIFGSNQDTVISTGIYYDTLQNILGCDSITTLIYGESHSFTNLQITVCDSYTVPSGNATYTASGLYNDTLVNQFGCDSILTINLTVNIVNSLVVHVGNILISDATWGSYQWVYCDSSFAPIINETDQMFTSPDNGNFALIIEQNSCIDTSDCFLITDVGLTDNFLEPYYHLYPNPFNNEFTIAFDHIFSLVSLELTNILGQNVLKESFYNSDKLQVDLVVPSGTYFGKIHVDGGETINFVVIRIE